MRPEAKRASLADYPSLVDYLRDVLSSEERDPDCGARPECAIRCYHVDDGRRSCYASRRVGEGS